MNISYSPIGYFKSPYTEIKGMPIQPIGAEDKGFSHVYVLYHLHQIEGYDLMIKPFLDTKRHGVFATRSPKRPNPIGLSVMRLIRVSGVHVFLKGIDVLDQTPVIDIKPYVADFDQCNADRFGWFEGKSRNATYHRSDERFAN